MALPRINLRSLKWIVAIAVMLLAILGANLALNWMTNMPSAAFSVVVVKGTVNRIPPATLQAVAKRAVQGNFFSVDMNSVRAEFEKLSWVRSASVRRIWPDRLEVTLEEHVPFARWGTDAMVNTHSEIFYAGYSGELPRFTGPSGSEGEIAEAYRNFRDILKEAQLEPKEVLLSPRRAWQVKLTNGMLLDLGRVEMQERLRRFVAVNNQVPELQGRKGRADLRYPNGFALKLMGPAATPKEVTAKTRE